MTHTPPLLPVPAIYHRIFRTPPEPGTTLWIHVFEQKALQSRISIIGQIVIDFLCKSRGINEFQKTIIRLCRRFSNPLFFRDFGWVQPISVVGNTRLLGPGQRCSPAPLAAATPPRGSAQVSQTPQAQKRRQLSLLPG